MEPTAFHTAKIPGRGRLYLDVLYDPDRTGAFFLWPHATQSAFEACARRVSCTTVDRERIVAMLKRQNRAIDAPQAALAAVERLRQKDAVTVFTGQQAGLFGGPLYTIHKAITLLGWAERLQQMLNRPVVPVFWIASDDHDFEEIRWTGLPDLDNQVRRFALSDDGVLPRVPASEIPVSTEIEGLIAEMRGSQLQTEFSELLFTDLQADYAVGRSLVEAFGRWMSRLLGRFGLVMFDPSDPEAKALCAPLISQEIEGHAATTSALDENGHRLEEYGYHRQVDHPEGHTHLFFIDNGRHAVRAADGNLWTDPENQRLSPGDWIGRLRSRPEAFSPGVLFRPVAQSYLFPVVSVICGPSEIAYWAQSRALFDRFDVTMPVVLPRSSATIIERKIKSAVADLGHDVSEFFGDVEALINRHFERSFPVDLVSRFAVEERELESRLALLKESVVSFEPTLDKTFDVDAGKIRASWEHLQKKVFQAHKRKGDEIRAKFYKLAAHLYPEGRPQERVFGIVYYLNKYGPSFLDRVREQLKIGTPDHQLIEP